MSFLNRHKTYILLAMLLVASVLVINQHPKEIVGLSQENIMKTTERFPIKLHEDWDVFADRVGYPKSPRPWHNIPLKELWNSISLGTRQRGQMVNAYFERGRYSFWLKEVTDITAYDMGMIAQGITEYSLEINKKGHSDRNVYDWTMALLGELKSKGWRKFVIPWEPRLKGNSSISSSIKGGDGIDADYPVSFDEWMANRDMSSLQWKLYADGMVVHISHLYFDKDPKTGQDSEHGFYLSSVEIRAYETHYMNYDGSIEATEGYLHGNWWREAVIEEKTRAQKERLEAEAKAKASGKEIDDSYKDPVPPPRPTMADKIPAKLPPDEPEASLICRTGEVCPRSGLWEARLPDSHPFAAYFAKSGMNRAFREQGMPMLPVGFNAEKEAQVVWVWLYDERRG